MVTDAQVIQQLEAYGFKFVRQTRHGALYRHSDGRATTIGKHYRNDEIPPGTLGAIRRQTNIPF